VSGKKYTELLRERILDPLKMTHSGLDADELLLPKRAQGYQPSDGGLIPARTESMSVPLGSGLHVFHRRRFTSGRTDVPGNSGRPIRGSSCRR
jgi:CubicO group peptidase (beta-lactamase class C family)